MKTVSIHYSKLILISITLLLSLCSVSCINEDSPIRSYEDIYGIWTQGDGHYIWYQDGNRAPNLYIEDQNGETIGIWEEDGYFYEPGYDLMIYIDKTSNPQVYKIIELNDNLLILCWVDSLLDHYEGGESISQIIGSVINKAQEGYDVNPDNYQYYTNVPEDEFLKIIDNINVIEPW